jgi:hypothetical protein
MLQTNSLAIEVTHTHYFRDHLFGVQVNAPDGSCVCLDRLDAHTREQVKQLQLAGLETSCFRKENIHRVFPNQLAKKNLSANENVPIAGRKHGAKTITRFERANAFPRPAVPNLQITR